MTESKTSFVTVLRYYKHSTKLCVYIRPKLTP